MRIVGGQFRGLTLAALGKGDPAVHLRPTSDRVRESLFNILTHMDVLQGSVVLDLFAGTGALGLEALSRGADHVTFVENGSKSVGLITQNVAKARAEAPTTLLRRDALGLPANPGAAATLVFLDPPYGKAMGIAALEAADAGGWIAAGATVVWEEQSPQIPPAGFLLVDTRRYGDTVITFLERAGP